MQHLSLKDWTEIIQNLAIAFATLFTAWWTYKTFYDKDKIKELKELKQTILLYRDKILRYAAQVRSNPIPDDEEIREKLELGALHNRLVELYHLHLFTDPATRKEIQNIVGKWIANDRLGKMPRRGNNWQLSEPERLAIFAELEGEFNNVLMIIDEEAHKKI